MYRQEAAEEYQHALKAGLKEQKALLAAGKNPYPAVLDTILGDYSDYTPKTVGILEIPADRIVGVKSSGRVAAFTAGFRPLLDLETEFASKWISLCCAHLSEGIQEPIECFEYLGNFYVQEGNKRVSVLRHFGAPRILASVRRILPQPSDEPRIRAYYEFLDFYQVSGLYQPQFRRPGDYAKLLSALEKEPDQLWTEEEQRTFSAYYQYFRDALAVLGSEFQDLLPEEALLLWLEVYPYKDLGELSAAELKKTILSLKDDLLTLCQDQPVEVKTEPDDVQAQSGILDWLLSGTPSHVNVAFVHPMDITTSTWAAGHDQGRKYLEEVLGDKVTVRSYFHADTPEQAEALMERAVDEGADVVFTTTPPLRAPTHRVAVKYPKVHFLNCSVDTPYASIRTYYGRIYEAKFITGAIAGAMANDDRIGYIGSYPIFGVPASINAFALGAQLTNPRAKIQLRWSCLPGTPQTQFLQEGIRVISNRDVPTQNKAYLNFCNYGTYQLDDDGNMEPLASPCWVWGKLYEKVIRSVLDGTYDKDKDSPRAVNYWWGMRSGAIDVTLSDLLPPGTAALAQTLRSALQAGTLDPFRRKIVAQNGQIMNDGSREFTAEELLHMDWLCDNVEGTIPRFDEILPIAQPTVRALGVYRDTIPPEKEGIG